MDIDKLTEPTHFARIAPPMKAGLSVDGADRREVRHRCGRCNNGTGIYNEHCPNNRDPEPEAA